MMNHRAIFGGMCVCAIAIFAALVLSCEKPPAPAPAAATTRVSPPENIYTVRGRIASLPAANKPGSSLQIEHEPIDNFVRQDGTLGMDSMTMPFPLAKDVALDGLAKDDLVEFVFEVRWKSQPRMQLTKITKLPPGTELHFGKASPAK